MLCPLRSLTVTCPDFMPSATRYLKWLPFSSFCVWSSERWRGSHPAVNRVVTQATCLRLLLVPTM